MTTNRKMSMSKNIDDMTPNEIRKLAESHGIRASAPIAVLKKRLAEKLAEAPSKAPPKAAPAPKKAAPVAPKAKVKPAPEPEPEEEEEEEEEEIEEEEVSADAAVTVVLAALDNEEVQAKILAIVAAAYAEGEPEEEEVEEEEETEEVEEEEEEEESDEEEEEEEEEESDDEEEEDEESEEEGEEEESTDEALEALPEEVRSFFVSSGVDDEGDPVFDLVLDVEQIDDLGEAELRALLTVLGYEDEAKAKGVRRLQVSLRKIVEENNKQAGGATELKKDQKVTYTHSDGTEYEAWIAGPEWVTKETGKVEKGKLRVYFEDESWDDVALSTITA